MPARKKDPSTRARRNKSSTAATLKVVSGTTDIPTLPPRRLQDPESHEWYEAAWHPQAEQWWADLWASPMAAEYHSSDRHALFLLAVLVDEFWRSPSKELAAEIRLQRQAFGLTPYDRRRLEWTIETAEDAKDKGDARRERKAIKQPAKKTDPRLTLAQ